MRSLHRSLRSLVLDTHLLCVATLAKKAVHLYHVVYPHSAMDHRQCLIPSGFVP